MRLIYMLLLVSVISLIGIVRIRESFKESMKNPSKEGSNKDYKKWMKDNNQSNKPHRKNFSKDIKILSDKVDTFTNEFKMYKDFIERFILKGYVISDMKPSINERMERIEKSLNI